MSRKTINIFCVFILYLLLPCCLFAAGIRITSAGDAIPHLDLQQYCLMKDDFNLLFDRISPLIKKSDIAIANFECSIKTNREISGFPVFNAHPLFMNALKQAGFNLLSLANNHALDMKTDGLRQILHFIKKYDLQANGIAANNSALYKPLYFTKNSIKISYLSITALTNGFINPKNNDDPKVNILNNKTFPAILNEIKEMKKQSDFVIISIHFGLEYTDKPTKQQIEYTRQIAAAGADLILGNHSHHIQKPELLKVDNRYVLCSFSQGNLVSHQAKLITYKKRKSKIAKRGDSYLLHIYIEKEDNTARISKVTYTPIWTLTVQDKRHTGYRSVLLFQEIKEALDAKQIPLLKYRRERIIKFMQGFELEEE